MPDASSFLDGNAAAGDLAQLFGTDMTVASGRCATCDHQLVLAEAHAFLGGPGTVLRCPDCGAVLFRMVRSPARIWLDASGLAYLEIKTNRGVSADF